MWKRGEKRAATESESAKSSKNEGDSKVFLKRVFRHANYSSSRFTIASLAGGCIKNTLTRTSFIARSTAVEAVKNISNSTYHHFFLGRAEPKPLVGGFFVGFSFARELQKKRRERVRRKFFRSITFRRESLVVWISEKFALPLVNRLHMMDD